MAAVTAARRSGRSGASGAGRSARKQHFGQEVPRVWTPPLRELTFQTSLGFAAIEFAETVCGVELFPWQKWLLIHALELADDLTVATMDDRGPLDPLFRFRKIVVLVARQNGKSTLSQVLSLFFLYELSTPLILGTAQDLDTAEEVWEGALDIIEETPELAGLAAKPIMVNGKKTIRLHSGERYKVKAANRKAGRGLSGDLILLDELREHQSWDAWGAITKTTNARPAAQIWALSNAGDATSVVLRYLRKLAHAELGDPDGVNAAEDIASTLPVEEQAAEALDDALSELVDEAIGELEDDPSTLGLFEWSAPPGCSVTDVEGILQANPSCGYAIPLRTILGDARDDPEWVFRTECLCQWSDGTLEGAFPTGTWEAGWPAEGEPDSSIALESDLSWCVDVAVNRTKAHIAVAGFRDDEIPHFEVVASRQGVDWVKPWFEERAGGKYPTMRTVIQARGAPGSFLVEELAGVDGVEVVEWGGSDLGIATGMIYDAVSMPDRAGARHNQQPVADVAASVAASKYLGGGAVVWDRMKSPADIAPLVAETGALWGLLRPQVAVEAPPPDIF